MIHPADLGDVDALQAIAVAAYEKYLPRIGRSPAPMTADYARAIRDRQVWAAVQDGELSGFAVLITQPGYLELENIAVLPAAQGRGIGAPLLRLAEDRAREPASTASSSVNPSADSQAFPRPVTATTSALP